ncbi:MAG: hypothetical protein ABEL51_05730, partial [Salinibacter sp.]
APERAERLREMPAIRRALQLERERQQRGQLEGAAREFPEAFRQIQRARNRLSEFQRQLPSPEAILGGRRESELPEFRRQLLELARLDVSDLSGREAIDQLATINQDLAEEIRSAAQPLLQAQASDVDRLGQLQERLTAALASGNRQLAENIRDQIDAIKTNTDAVRDQTREMSKAERQFRDTRPVGVFGDDNDERARQLLENVPAPIREALGAFTEPASASDSATRQPAGPTPPQQPLGSKDLQGTSTAPQTTGAQASGNVVQFHMGDVRFSTLEHLSADQLRALLQDPDVQEDLRQAIEDKLQERAAQQGTRVMK